MNFNFNLNETLNAEPMGPQVRCGHCRQLGHTMPHCRRARSDGHNLHLRIINGMHNSHDAQRAGIRLDDWLRIILENMTIRQLKLLMHSIQVEGRGTTFIRTLVIYGIISNDVSLLRIKQDRVTILMWFYLNHHHHDVPIIPIRTPVPKKLDIISQLQEETTSIDEKIFDCPICLNSHDKKEKLVSNCNHALCKPCLTNYLDHHIANTFSDKKPCCSLCRTNITSITFANNEYKEEVSKKYFTSIDDIIY